MKQDVPAFAIRLARSKDVGRLAALERQAFTGDRLSARSFRDLIKSKSAVVLIATTSSLPGIEGAAIEKFYYLPGDCLAHSRDRLQAANAFRSSDLLERDGPGFDRFGGVSVGTQSKRIVAANVH